MLAFNVQPDPALGSSIPFIRNAAGGNIPGATVSPLYLVTPSGTLTLDPTGANTPRTLQASLAISGAGASQQSVVVLNLGLISDAAPQLIGALRGTSQLSSAGTPVLISSALGSIWDGVGGGLYGTSGVSGIALGATSPFATETPLGGTPTTYNFNHPATVTTLPAGVGPGLGTTGTFIPASGYFGGSMFTNANSPVAPYVVTGSTTFTQTGPATFSANFTSDQLTNLGNGFFFPPNPTVGLNTLNLTFGGNASGTPNSTIIDGNIYGATESSTGATLAGGEGASFPGTQQLYLLSSSAAAPPASLLAGGTLCSTCAFSQWGYWGGAVTSNFGQSNRVDLGNINFWVAGQPTAIPLQFTGTATYMGQAIGSVNNNGAQYVASGNFTNAYTFNSGGFGSGNFTLNFDGRNLTGQVGPTGMDPTVYSSTCDCTGFNGTNLAGVVDGRFFGPSTATTAPPETGGSFAFGTTSGLPYLAAGVFQGHR